MRVRNPVTWLVIVLALFAVAIPKLSGQVSEPQAFPDTLEIDLTSKDKFLRPMPVTLEEAQQVAAGLSDLLNKVIADDEKADAAASDRIKQLILDSKKIAVQAKKADQLLGGAVAGVIAKTWALGAYVDLNPLPSLGGATFGAAASLTWNLLNALPIEGRFGFVSNAGTPIRLDTSLAAQWWLN